MVLSVYLCNLILKAFDMLKSVISNIQNWNYFRFAPYHQWSNSKNFEKFETWLKFGWFHLKLYSMFQDLIRRSIETGFWRICDAAQIN